MTPDKKVLKSIISLEHDGDWKNFVEWLRQGHVNTAIDSTNHIGEARILLGGQAQMLQMILERIDTAKVRLQTITEEKKNIGKGLVI